jgi:hypothetical protein
MVGLNVLGRPGGLGVVLAEEPEGGALLWSLRKLVVEQALESADELVFVSLPAEQTLDESGFQSLFVQAVSEMAGIERLDQGGWELAQHFGFEQLLGVSVLQAGQGGDMSSAQDQVRRQLVANQATK